MNGPCNDNEVDRVYYYFEHYNVNNIRTVIDKQIEWENLNNIPTADCDQIRNRKNNKNPKPDRLRGGRYVNSSREKHATQVIHQILTIYF